MSMLPSHSALRLRPSLLLLALAPIAAQAHPGHPAGSAWEQGMLHPLTGLDHLLAILAVGLWASRSEGALRWAIPAGFLGLMAAGAAAGQTGGILPGIESVVLASVFVLGLLVATARRMPVTLSLAMTAIFAVAHGYAHGAELAAGAERGSYTAGFLAVTAVLLALGWGAGRMAQSGHRTGWLRWAGAGIMAGGLVCLAA